jgi:hypothetical protein
VVGVAVAQRPRPRGVALARGCDPAALAALALCFPRLVAVPVGVLVGIVAASALARAYRSTASAATTRRASAERRLRGVAPLPASFMPYFGNDPKKPCSWSP